MSESQGHHLMPEPVTSALASAAGPVVKAAIQGIGPTLAKRVGKLTSAAYDRLLVALGLGLHDYLNTSYLKSRYFKTILNPTMPLSVMDNYIHVSLSHDKVTYSDDEFIEHVQSRKHVVVTGLAGSGKSMLMKYITLCKFESPKGVIPLFIELRQLNPLTERNLLAFIRLTCVSSNSELTGNQFDVALRAGVFLIILDGFDELNYDFREEIQRQILALEKNYPECAVLISSRPDDRFGSWTSYFVYEVSALSNRQSVQLINSLPYDAGVKRRFAKEVSSRLYSSHTSFLSSPLLTTIMLLTYESFAEIPDKMHAFYGHAFDTLFQKHDAQKEQFQRRTHTGLSLDDFKATFAAFCAISYLEERFAFDEHELVFTAENAISYMSSARSGVKIPPTTPQLVEDLKSSVCMLQQDGLKVAFVHRSFQEYFAAVFAVQLHSSKVRKLLDKYALRFSDAAISMALEMSRELIEQEWVLPTIDALTHVFENGGGETAAQRLARIIPNIYFERTPKLVRVSAFDFKVPTFSQYHALAKLYPISRNLVFHQIADVSHSKFEEALSNPDGADRSKARKLRAWFNLKEERHVFQSDTVSQSWLLERLNVHAVLDRTVHSLAAIKREIMTREERKNSILDDFI